MQELFEQTPENCFLMPIINGTDGRKMSKSFNNCIFINDKPEDIFGKVMSISDSTMKEWIPIFFDKIDESHPLKMKKLLAHKIVELIWNGKGDFAKSHFESVIQGSSIPEDINELSITNIIDVIKSIRKSSGSEARRLLKSNAVKINGDVITSEDLVLTIGDIIKIGKRDFAKII